MKYSTIKSRGENKPHYWVEWNNVVSGYTYGSAEGKIEALLAVQQEQEPHDWVAVRMWNDKSTTVTEWRRKHSPEAFSITIVSWQGKQKLDSEMRKIRDHLNFGK